MTEHETKNPDHESFHEMEKLGMPQKLVIAAKLFVKIYDAFDNFKEMQNFVDEHSGEQYSVFDFDWNLPEDDPTYFKNLLLTMTSVLVGNEHAESHFDNMFTDFSDDLADFLKDLGPKNRFKKIVKTNRSDAKFMKKILWQIYDDVDRSCLDWMNEQNKLGGFLHPAMTFLSQSTKPNIFVTINKCKEIIWTVNQPVAAGSQLSFGVLTDERTEKMPKSKDAVMERLKNCCDYINMNYKNRNQNAKFQQNITTKKIMMQQVLSTLGNPFTPSNL